MKSCTNLFPISGIYLSRQLISTLMGYIYQCPKLTIGICIYLHAFNMLLW